MVIQITRFQNSRSANTAASLDNRSQRICTITWGNRPFNHRKAAILNISLYFPEPVTIFNSTFRPCRSINGRVDSQVTRLRIPQNTASRKSIRFRRSPRTTQGKSHHATHQVQVFQHPKPPRFLPLLLKAGKTVNSIYRPA